MSNRAAQFRALYRDLRIADQWRYYRDRSTEYGHAHRQAIAVRNTMLVLAAAVGAGSQFANGTGRAALGVAAALLGAIAAAVTAFEALIGFPQLEKLYGDAALNIAEAAVDWDTAAANDDQTVDIKTVEQVMRIENGQWGQLMIAGRGREAGNARDSGG